MNSYRWIPADGTGVQVYRDGHAILVRDGKLGDDSLEQCWSPNSWRRLVAALARGEDHPDVIVETGCVTLGRILPLRFTSGEWAAFVAGVKAGEFTPEKLSSPAPSEGCDAGRPVGSAGGERPDHVAAGAGGDCPAPVAPAPVAAHREVAGWVGGGPGQCGVECACGTTFDGFDTIAEAAALLDEHIATANAPDSAPVAAQSPEDQQIATIKAHFTRRCETLTARAERAERERDSLARRLGVRFGELEEARAALGDRYVLDRDAVLELVQRYGAARIKVDRSYFRDHNEHRAAKEAADELLDAIRAALTPVPDVEPDPFNAEETTAAAARRFASELERLMAGLRDRGILPAPDAPVNTAAVDTALMAIDDLLADGDEDPRHVIDLREDGWTIKHPLSCRPNLFDCPVNRAAERDLTEPPAALGRFECSANDLGDRLLIGDRVEEPSAAQPVWGSGPLVEHNPEDGTR